MSFLLQRTGEIDRGPSCAQGALPGGGVLQLSLRVSICLAMAAAAALLPPTQPAQLLWVPGSATYTGCRGVQALDYMFSRALTCGWEW
jgi:hypothetical protein